MNKLQQWNVESIRRDFPILAESVNGHPLAYLDNAATTQKPKAVIDSMTDYYTYSNSNVHRGVHYLSVRATELYEAARDKVKRFINANDRRECIFVRGTTEAINLVADAFVTPRLLPNEAILLTHMEHHSNIVPWQMMCKKTGARLLVAPISLDGTLRMDEFERLLAKNVKFVAVTYGSNALGTINPIKDIVRLAHKYGALVLVDGAQSTAHMPIDVQDLDCDFYAFSGHKMYGPTGIGVLWGRYELLESMPPYQGGGEMIKQVTFEATEYADLPQKFEAGTPNIAGAIGLGAAIDYLGALDIEATSLYEAKLLEYATNAISNIRGFNLMATHEHKLPILSFVHGKIHAHDVGTILDSLGIAIRSGHHCTMPLMDFFEVAATNRISLSFYNTYEEIDRLVLALQNVKEVFA